jgi:hypothetical protein
MEFARAHQPKDTEVNVQQERKQQSVPPCRIRQCIALRMALLATPTNHSSMVAHTPPQPSGCMYFHWRSGSGSGSCSAGWLTLECTVHRQTESMGWNVICLPCTPINRTQLTRKTSPSKFKAASFNDAAFAVQHGKRKHFLLLFPRGPTVWHCHLVPMCRRTAHRVREGTAGCSLHSYH